MKESQFLYEKMTLSTCDVVMSAVYLNFREKKLISRKILVWYIYQQEKKNSVVLKIYMGSTLLLCIVHNYGGGIGKF